MIKNITKSIFNRAQILVYLLILKIKTSFYKAKVVKNSETEKIVLFFLPELEISLYLDMLISIANDIKGKGYIPVFFGCNGFLSNCMLMDRTNNLSRTIKTSILCANCSLRGKNKITNNNFDYLECNQTKNKSVLFHSNSVDERLFYCYENIPVGRLAYYDLSIKFKRDRERRYLSDNEQTFYDSIITDGINLVDFLNGNPLSKSAEAVIVIDEYSLANIVREWARKNNKLAYRAGFSYHFNADPQFVTLSADRTRASEKSIRAEIWKDWEKLPLPPAIVKEIASDLIFRMSGTGGHIFSSNYSGNLEKLTSKYFVRSNVKTLVVFTSANDEIDAIEELSQALGDSFLVKDAFENQLSWIKYIIDYAENNDVQVIIKMHPRLSISHRDTGVAEDIHFYKKIAASAPRNVIFIWPEDEVSAYDILQLADICLTSWGTMGLEAAKLGVPVVSGITRITFATPRLALFSKAETIDQFYEMITKPIETVRLEDIIEAYRWHHLLHIGGSIIVNGARELKLYNSRFELGFSEVLQGLNIVEEKYKYLVNQVELNKEGAEKLELQAMSNSIDRLISFFEKGDIASAPHSKLLNRLRQVIKPCEDIDDKDI